MPGLPILDVCIGMIFIFMLLSLVVTAANELISSWLKRRPATLYRGVSRLLTDPALTEKLFAHPLIASLNEKPWGGDWRKKVPFNPRPSYIPSRTFALALLDTLGLLTPPSPGVSRGQPADNDAEAAKRNDGKVTRDLLQERLSTQETPQELVRSLKVLLEEADGDIEKFKKQIEGWFNLAMERVSGWYKRRTQWILLVLAVLVTGGLNADAIVIAKVLWRDPSVRAVVVREAEQYQRTAQTPPGGAKETKAAGTGDTNAGKTNTDAVTKEVASGPPAPPDLLPDEEDSGQEQQFTDAVARVMSLPIPLGWSDEGGNKNAEPMPSSLHEWCEALAHHAAGWLLTALAISLGAPFWFDTLNKVMSIRGSGKAPQETQNPPKK